MQESAMARLKLKLVYQFNGSGVGSFSFGLSLVKWFGLGSSSTKPAKPIIKFRSFMNVKKIKQFKILSYTTVRT